MTTHHDAPLRFFATCAKGIEYLLVDELRNLGATDVREVLAGVAFEGTLDTGYRACLWSRLASRVLLPILVFDAPDDAALYEAVSSIDWQEHLHADGTLAVNANLFASKLSHERYAEQRVKDAIVDQFRNRAGERPSVDTAQPDVRINLRVSRDRGTLSIDLSGDSLHRRGWRVEQVAAPLKETLACAVLQRAGWPQTMANGGALVDPMCGSGTLLIEAARYAADIAPGLQRTYFGFQRWRGHDLAAWQAMKADAQARAERGIAALTPRFFGYDIDPAAVQMARRNAESALVANALWFETRAVADLAPPEDATAGLVVCNPPYDERLAADATLYRELGAALKRGFAGWRAGVLSADADLTRALGLRAEKKYKLYNGALECELLRIDHIEPRRTATHTPVVLSEGAQMVANRLRKNLRTLKNWREREGVTCYRVYDADIPEYASAIDVYKGVPEGGEPVDPSGDIWLHVQEYQAPSDIPEDVARQRLQDLVNAALHVFELPRGRVALKTRQRGKGGSKYARSERRGEFLRVREGSATLRVNLFDHLDAGLFLDHRPLRMRMAIEARGKRVLNLFCYTGAVTVQAGVGGAAATTSVDLSANYLEWAAQNLALNGLRGEQHRLVQADVLQWLRAERGEYDLIFCDPPTFSNSARADDFDLQREHVALLQACMARLSFGGLLIFSNNFRRFRMDPVIAETFDVTDITAKTIPQDFSRNARIHSAWEIRERSTR